MTVDCCTTLLFIFTFICYSLVLSHLSFGILIWGCKCERVTKLQKKVIIIICLSKYNTHTEPLFKKYNLFKLCDILKLQELKFYFKYKNYKLPHYLQSWLFHANTETHDHATRISHKIHQPICKHAFAKGCISSDIKLIVNNCPHSILDQIFTHSRKGFSGYIKTHFLQSYRECCIFHRGFYCWRVGSE